MISDVVRRSCAISLDASQAMLSVPPADVCLSSGVLNGGTATTATAAAPGCCACAAEPTAAVVTSSHLNFEVKIIAPWT